VSPSLAIFRENWRSQLLVMPEAVSVPRKSWVKYFPSEAQELFSSQFFSDQFVSINQLKNLAESGISSRTLFVATMMWGRGQRNGRLMPKFKQVAEDEEFAATLQMTRDLVTEGAHVEAYQAWTKSGIQGIREPFFTKWFFVCGLDSRSAGRQPLTLDSRVWNSLSEIGWLRELQTGFKYRKHSADTYGTYLEAMSFWAHELSDRAGKISPLQLEQFFFRKNGKNLV